MIFMDVDTALAEVPVNAMPLLDDTDFKSIEASVAYNAAGMALYWHFVTSAGVETTTQVTPTTAGTYDWAHAGQGMYTIEIPASGGASINNDTEGYGYFTGVATGVLPWRGPTIGFRAAALNDALCDGGDLLDVNATQFGGTNGTFSGGRPEVNTTHAAGTAWNSGAIGASTLASDTIAAAKIATGAITAAKFAASAIDAAALAADAVAEIQSGLATAAALDAVDNFIDTEIASIISTLGTPAGASLAADLVVIDDFVDALESRLTAARAGYLDNINNSALASVPAFPSNFASLGINASGHVSRVTLVDTTTTNTDMISAAGIRTAVGLASANLDTQLTAIDDYLDTELAAVLAAVDTEIAAIVAAIGTPSNLGGGATLAANLSDIEGQTDDIGTAGAGLTAIPWNASWDTEVQSEVTDALNAALTESYRADQATGSVAQMLYELIAHHGEVSIGGTTKTLKKIDGSTTAMSFTLNSGTTPTAVTRAA